jgi:integrase
MPLTEKEAKTIKAKGGQLMDGVVPNLMLKSNGKAGRGMWVFRYVSPTVLGPSGKAKRRDMGLGTFPITTIALARDAARECLGLLAKGIDPLEKRQAAKKERLAKAAVKTFEETCNAYLDLNKGNWKKGSKSPDQWESSLKTYAYPKIGKLPVDQITAEQFRDVLKPIWLKKPETSTRLFQRCNKIMLWARSTRMVSTNPLDITRELLPKRKSASSTRVHFPSLPWKDVPQLVHDILRNGPIGTCREALEFLILSGCRSGEVRGMLWSEVDMQTNIWTIPGTRMKAGKEHRVPLTLRMQEILKKQSENGRGTALVFPAPRDGEFSDNTLSKFLRDHKVPSDTPGRSATVHGFRSSFRTWGAENDIPENVMELILAHTERNAVVAAYKRTDLIEARLDAMEKWSKFIDAYGSNKVGVVTK